MAKGRPFGGPGGMGGMGGGNMQQLMRQAQKMQEQMAAAQEELDAREYEATSGGGMVTCRVSGKRELLSLVIKPEAVDPEDTEMLQDLIIAAVNEALRQGEETREKTMAAMAPGMGGLL
ncbi:MAG TPA: YbaB/EbfC family nucleoid-associated protein [Candidatus Limnocylindria bacterium]|nr:YbaB/EbfC family nucleoid-associated protein [Candidatus Limnocylindria bacterium]